MTGLCSLCGRLGRVERHHPTRRPCRGAPYFDVGFTVPLCCPCHALVHQVLRVAGLDWPQSGAHPLGYRLSATAVHAELIAAAERPLVVAPKSARAFAGLLREAAGDLDARGSAKAGAA